MADYRGDNEGNSFCFSDFQEKLRSFGTLKKLTCFFESANFLMTEYHLVDDRIRAVFENEQGDTLQFRELLCGYSGHGSNNTMQVLLYLGISEDIANECCYSEDHKGFQMELTQEGTAGKYKACRVTFHNWFSSFDDPKLHRLIYTGDDITCSVMKQILVFSSISRGNMPSLVRCLQLMEPFSFEYSLDKGNPLQTEKELVDAGLIPQGVYRCHEKRDANLFMQGERFSMYCCISGVALLGILNALYFCLSGKDLFYEKRIGNFVFYLESDKKKPTLLDVLKLLLSKAPEKKQCRLPIERSMLW